MFKALVTIFISIFFWTCIVSPASAEDWPTVAKNSQRTGQTNEALPTISSAGLTTKWSKTFQYENIATVAQVITGGGRVYIGTMGRNDGTGNIGGKIYALNPDTGDTLWQYADLKGGVAHSVTYDSHLGGTVLSATTLGEVFALNASTGQLRWKYEAGFGGFTTSPTVANSTVLLGSRDGSFYAFTLDGQLRWKKEIGVPINNTSAVSNGIVYFMDESITGHALQISDGSNVANWPTTRLAGGSARHYWPVIAGDYVLFRVAQPHSYNWTEIEGVMGLGCNPRAVETCVQQPAPTVSQEEAEQNALLAHNQQDPFDDTLKIVHRTTGQLVASTATHVGGSGSVNTPPVVRSNGDIIVEYRTKYSVWDFWGWVNPLSAMGKLNPVTGKITQLIPSNLVSTNNPTWGHFFIIADESSSFSIAGSAESDTLINTYQGSLGGIRLGNRQTLFIHGKRDTYAGQSATTWSRQEWHGAPRNPVTVSNGKLYYHAGGRIVAVGL